MPGNSNDRALLSRLVAGDEGALREVYRAHAPAVHGLALRVLSNEALAQDVVQDVFVRLWEQPERFDVSRGALRNFLLSMTHSRAVERVRAEESLRNRHAKLERQPAKEVDDPARVLVTQETEEAIRGALAALPDMQRRPIEMAYFDGLSYRDVARELGEPEGTVKYRIRMGMKQMRAVLRDREDAP